MANKKLSELLHKMRTTAGLTQLDVSETLGYSTPQFISNWERGVSSPPVSMLKRLALLYKVDPEVLFQHVLKERLWEVEADLRQKYRSLRGSRT